MDFGKLIDGINKILGMIFGDQVPGWLITLIGYLLLFALALLALVGLLAAISKILKIWHDEIRPRFYNAEEIRHRERRRQYADHIESEIRRLNNLEAWNDYHFAELEAEVEAEGRRRIYKFLPFLVRTRSGLQREHSLSKALEKSEERLILLEGDPGSGKSVALRHVAQRMAQQAIKARSVSCVIPVYINLKEMERSDDEQINSTLVRKFVHKVMNRVNDRDIEVFLESEFNLGLEKGTWLFLFDSFDEIPGVLSSIEADKVIRDYAGAISDFLHGMNRCRGVVASRQFRGPGQLGWPRFQITSLTEKQRIGLIRKSGLEISVANDLTGNLSMATDAIRLMASNPMFLGLLCEYMQGGHSFPDNAHSVFETYVLHRLNRDSERLQKRFNVTPAIVRSAAEYIAFCMAADVNLGLSPTRTSIKAALARQSLELLGDFSTLLNALEYLKLARSETATASDDSKSFTFAHRRFQEYFATCVVLREPHRVSARELLSNARWRETVVVFCQTQHFQALPFIIAEARSELENLVQSVPEIIDQPLEYINRSPGIEQETGAPVVFPWPSGALHLLSLLQDGFGNRLQELHDDIRLMAAKIVLTAYSCGTLTDRKWAVENAGIVPASILVYLLRKAFVSRSQRLKDVAYRQAARLRDIPEDIAKLIRRAVIDLKMDGRLRRERFATQAHLARLDQSPRFLAVMQLLLWSETAIVIAYSIIALVVALEIVGSNDFAYRAMSLAMLFVSCLLGILLVSRSRSRFLGNDITLLCLGAQFAIGYQLFVWSDSYLKLINLALFIYVASLPLVVTSCASMGRLLPPFWKPYLPVAPILLITSSFKSFNLQKITKNALWIIGFISISAAIFILVFTTWLIVIVQVIGVVTICLAIGLGIYSGITWLRDTVKWGKWSQQTHAVSEDALLTLLTKPYIKKHGVAFLRIIRESGMLEVTRITSQSIDLIFPRLSGQSVKT